MSQDASTVLLTIQREFIAGLPDRLERLNRLFNEIDLAVWPGTIIPDLQRELHSLSGTAGSYGLSLLTEASRKLEAKLDDMLEREEVPSESEWDQFAKALVRLRLVAEAPNANFASDFLAPERPVRDTRTPLIYLVEDDVGLCFRVEEALSSEGFRVRCFHGSDDFRQAILDDNEEKPSVVVMDLMFPQGDDTGITLMTELGIGGDSGTPVLVVSAKDDINSRLGAFRSGACRYITKPYNIGQLTDVLDHLTGRQPPVPFRVLLVDDDPDLLKMQTAVLEEAGIKVCALSKPLQTLDVIDEFAPDVIVLDVHMPGVTGPELAAILRERDAYLQVPILFLSAETDISRQLQALSLGGDDFLVKPIKPDHFVAAVTARARRIRQNRAMMRRLETMLYERDREHQALNRHAFVSVAGGDGLIMHVNDRFCEMTGYRRDELIGQNHSYLKSGQHDAAFYREMWHTLLRGQTWQGDICNRRKNGCLFWWHTTITPFVDADGKPYQFVSINTDITDIKERQSALQTLVDCTTSVRGQAMLQKSVQGLARLTGMEMSFVALLDTQDRDYIQMASFWNQDRFESMPPFLLQHTPSEQVLQDRLKIIHQGASQQFPLDTSLVQAGIDGYLAVALENASGEALGVIGIMDTKPLQDVETKHSLVKLFATRVASEIERSQNEEEIEQHKERFRRGQLFANIGTWEWLGDSDEIIWSEMMGPLFGLPKGACTLPYAAVNNMIFADDRERVQLVFQTSWLEIKPFEVEHRVMHPDGSIRWLLQRGSVSCDAAGQPKQMLGVVQDIHDRKQAELARIESERQLQRAQAIAHVGSWQFDRQQGRMLWSDELFRIFGHQPGSVQPSVELFESVIHNDDLARVKQAQATADDTGYLDISYRITLPNGSTRHVHHLGFIEFDHDGVILHQAGTIQDVTAQVDAQQQLVAAVYAAERANQAKSQFLSNMSHELRTPMNAILGFSQILDYDPELSEDHRENVTEILKAGNHLLALINEVLDLAKVESGLIDLSICAVELQPLIDACLTLVRPLAAKREIALINRCEGHIAVRADATRLKQVLLNLLSNAIKYNRDQGQVVVDFCVQETELHIRVKDTGNGIPADRLSELFQPFNRLDAEHSNIEGTGIGLTLTRNIVELMGGRVEVASTVGEGSTFEIVLPHVPSMMPLNKVAQDQVADMTSDGLTSDYEQHQVLYVEDNPANLKLVSQIMTQLPNVELITAHTPRLGLELALSHLPRLILLDINMPGMNGFQVLELLKNDEATAHIPVIALSAYAMPGDIDKGLKAGFVEYVTKPLNVSSFLKLVENLLSGSENRV